jgi:hypothetical protein
MRDNDAKSKFLWCGGCLRDPCSKLVLFLDDGASDLENATGQSHSIYDILIIGGDFKTKCMKERKIQIRKSTVI